MTLRDILDRYSDSLDQIVAQIEDGVLDADTEAQLRDRIEQTPSAERQVLVDEYPQLANLEVALGLEPTMPDPSIGVVEDTPDDVEVTFLSPEEQQAVEDVESMLERTHDRGLDWFRGLEQALRTGVADHATALTQTTLDRIPDEDRERLLEIAQAQREQIEQEELELEDFDGIMRALERGGGRSIPYFRNVIDELRGDADPDRIPASELDRAPQHVIDAAIEVAENQISRLEGTDRPDTAPDRDPRRQPSADPTVESPLDTPLDDMDRMGDRYVVTEDYISGEQITRDLEFEEKFARLARRLGYARNFDITNPQSQHDRQSYFQLTAENQRLYYDVTPTEFFARRIRTGDIKYQELVNMGFDEEYLPDPDDL